MNASEFDKLVVARLGYRHSRVLVLLSRIFKYKGVNRRKSADRCGWEWSYGQS
jgi:hypothetical protein